MKCRLCGARVRRKEDHCTQCGAKIMRNPNASKKLMMRLFLFLLVLLLVLLLFAGCMMIYDKVHRSDALLPGLYTGMTKQEMLKTLKTDYPVFYSGGKQMRNPTGERGKENTLVDVAYTNYSNALGLNRPMCFEATFYTLSGQEFLDTYSITMPYIMNAEDGGTNKTAIHDIQTKIVPVLTEQYGASEPAGGETEYLAHFNFVESVRATQTRLSKLPGYGDALLGEFSSYEDMSFCVRITYEGYSFTKLRKQLSGD